MLQYCRKYDFQGFRSLVFLQYHMILSDPAEIQVSPSLPSHFLLLPSNASYFIGHTQNILSSSSLLYKEHLYSFLRPWLGDGLLTSSGARWLKHQKLYVPAFERAAIEGYLRVVHRTGGKFVQQLLAMQADPVQPFDAQQLVAKCTLDIVCGKVWVWVWAKRGDWSYPFWENLKHLSQAFCTAVFKVWGLWRRHPFISVIYYAHFINKIYGPRIL